MRQPQFGAPRGPQGPVGLQSASREQRRVMQRLLRFVMRHYRWSLLVVCLCILLSSVTSLVSSLFTRTLIDDYIAPLLASTAAGAEADYAPLALGLLRLGAVLLLGTACGYLYNRLMIRVSQGTMLRLRKHDTPVAEIAEKLGYKTHSAVVKRLNRLVGQYNGKIPIPPKQMLAMEKWLEENYESEW